MYKCPICECYFDIPENGIKIMNDKECRNNFNLNPIIICCPNNDGYSVICTSYIDYDEERKEYYNMSSWRVGMTYMPSTPPNTNEIKGTFIGNKINTN